MAGYSSCFSRGKNPQFVHSLLFMANSEVELDGQLDLPWPACPSSRADGVQLTEAETAATRSTSEIGYVACGIECRRDIEETPLSVVPDIVEFGPELKVTGSALPAKRNVFENRHVPV